MILEEILVERGVLLEVLVVVLDDRDVFAPGLSIVLFAAVVERGSSVDATVSVVPLVGDMVALMDVGFLWLESCWHYGIFICMIYV